MRRAVVISLLAALTLPALGAAARSAPSTGALSIRKGDGGLVLSLRGVVIGRFDTGTLIVDLPLDEPCAAVRVWGAEETSEERVVRDAGLHEAGLPGPRLGELVRACRYAGRGLRFRVPGRTTVRLRYARDLDLSAVGTGVGTIKGAGGADGTYSINGAPYASLPDELEPIVLGPAKG